MDLKKIINRRDFLSISAIGSLIGAFFLTFLGLIKFPMPALLPEVSNIFKIGKPEDIPTGTERIIREKNVRLVKDVAGIYAVSLICTHLGCIVTKTETGYSCPCHGSKFDNSGNVIFGPAPKGLNWLEVSQLPDGTLVVNADKNVPQETRFVI
jgi:cytochrome b6-f complex iron-sulfur subunit